MRIARSAGALVALGATLIVTANTAIAEDGGARALGIDSMGSLGIDSNGSQVSIRTAVRVSIRTAV